ncbi:MAG: hypothetical protein Q4C89_03650 [Deinococcus sp.]|uniref:hypothetical protein n=1 Tax=Deinococcus sp. TaxID=47478 RepID=UPI0026DC6D5B|nr:hypothetical protein [Deinococcus sp.]MDO4245098.1 hypothetical protein [Deinococcus sp.]
MKTSSRLVLAGAGLCMMGLLSSCFPVRPPYEKPVTVKFTLPADSATEKLSVAALYTTRDTAGNVIQKRVDNTLGYVYGSEGSVTLYKAQLDKVISDQNCLPYRADKVKQVTKPASVRSCDINFVAYDPAQMAGDPTTANLRYLTHDTYSYASEAYTYTSTFSGKDGDATVTSQETGSRRAGWSLVTHLVLNPSSTPNTYQVIRNSVDDSQLNLARTMHRPSDYFTSMSVTGGKQ